MSGLGEGEPDLGQDLASGLDPLPPQKQQDQRAREPDRFYCPYPGCNRSFAELWRLKVHYRAPPDIRGSGKERGHGTELTHCPKCGKTLKPGKHHVGCSGGKTAPRQANKRSRTANDAEPPDEALVGSPTIKQIRGGEFDDQLHPPSWQDFSGTYPIAPGSVALPGTLLKQERPEWATGAQPLIYGHPAAPGSVWMDPGQMNGFVPQVQPQVFAQPQYAHELHFAGGAHPGFTQLPQYANFPGYPHATMQGITSSGQVVTLPAGSTLSMPGMGPGGMPMQAMLMHSQQLAQMAGQHQQQQQQPQQQPQQQQQPTEQQQQQPQHQPQQPQQLALPASGSLDEVQQPQGAAGPSGQQPAEDAQRQQQGGTAGPSGGTAGAGPGGGGTAGSGSGAAEAGSGVGTAGPPSRLGSTPAPPGAAPPSASANDLGSMFEDVEEFTRDFGRIPSPPPLPPDFHSANSGSGAGMLFNFGQFSQKIPRSGSVSRFENNLVAAGLDPGLDTEALYDHTDDGDLMQLLFGVPDELPSMATIHLHNWGNHGEEDEEAGARQGGQEGGEAGPAAAAGGSRPTENGTAGTGQQGPGQPDGQRGGGMLQQGDQPPRLLQLSVDALAREVNGKGGAELQGSAGAGPGSDAVHGSGLKQLHVAHINGLNHSTGGDDHPRDHLLDAETFRLLQSCD